MALNYSAFAPTVSPLQGIEQGMNLAQAAMAGEKRQLEMQQYQQAMQQKQQLQRDMAELTANPSPQRYAQMLSKYPSLSESLKSSYDVMSEQQRQGQVSFASQLYSAIEAGQPEIAERMLEERIAATDDPQQQAGLKANLEILRASPDAAKTTAGLFLSSALGPDKFAETWSKISQAQIDRQLAGPKLSKAQSDAAKAATEARFAELKPAMDAAAQGLDISFMINDPGMKRINTELAVKNKQIQNLEKQNKLAEAERLRLQVADLRFKQDQDAQQLLANTRNELDSAQYSIDTIQNAIDLANVDVGLGRTAIDAATGSIEGAFPAVGSDQDVSNFINALETVGAETFMKGVQAMKGLGALSEREGAKAEALLGNLSRTQDATIVMQNMQRLLDLFKNGQEKLQQKYGNYQRAIDAYNANRGGATDVRAQADAILRGE